MKTILPTILTVLFLNANESRSALINAWINEIHYDNDGADIGEFVEVVLPANVTDLRNVVVAFYRAEDGTSYYSSLLSSFTSGESQNGFTAYSKAISGIQNGPSDGVALSYNGTLIQFLSYEGTLTGSGGVADHVTSVDIGVQEYDSAATPSGASLGLTGTGSHYSDFSWVTFSDDSPGAFNVGQTVVPEPAEWGALSGGGLLLLCAVQTWRERRQKTGAKFGRQPAL